METTNNETTNNINKEDALKDLSVIINEDEYIKKSGLPQELATLIYAAYRKGVETYQKECWEAKENRDQFKADYEKLAVRLADFILGKKPNIVLPL